MSLIVGASRSIFARDGPVLLKAVTTRQRQKHCGNLTSSGCMLSVCLVLCVYHFDLAICETPQLGSSGAARAWPQSQHSHCITLINETSYYKQVSNPYNGWCVVDKEIK